MNAVRKWWERRKWRVFDPDPRPWNQRVADSRTLPPEPRAEEEARAAMSPLERLGKMVQAEQDEAARLRRVLWRIAEDPGEDENGRGGLLAEADAWRRAKDMAIDALGEKAEPCRPGPRP